MSDKPDSVLSHIIREHSLQAFNPRYFTDDSNSQVFSFSEEQCQNAQLLRLGADPQTPFFTEPLPPPDDSWRTIELNQLIRFFANPTQYLLRERLGIQLSGGTDQLQEREPFELDNLERYVHRNRLLAARLSDHNTANKTADLAAQERVSGWLPHGVLGNLLLDGYQHEVAQFAEKLTEQAINFLPPIEVDLSLGPFRLVGWLDNIDTSRGALFYRMGKLSGKEIITFLLSHLVINSIESNAPGSDAQESQAFATTSEYVTPEASLNLSPCHNAANILTNLLETYWRGLSEPLRFFPKSSYEFAAASWADKDPRAAARKTWFGDERYGLGESNNPYYQLAFTDGKPLDESFEALALELFAPIQILKI